MSVALVQPADANPVRTARPARVVQIRYTEFARVRTRYHTLFGPTPEEAAAQLLREANLSPRQVRVKVQAIGDVAVFRVMPQDLPPEFRPGQAMPIAFVDGLSESELASALAALAAGAAAA